MKFLLALTVALAIAALAACGGDDDSADDGNATTAPAATGPITFTSEAFTSGQPIPIVHSCEGENTSPPLAWSNLPRAAQSLAIEVIDPDAGGYVHWLLFDLPVTVTSLPAGVAPDAELDNGGKQAINTSGDIGYAGPCPPSGEEHSYTFRIYALDAVLDQEGGGSARNVQDALADHTLAVSELVGTFQR